MTYLTIMSQGIKKSIYSLTIIGVVKTRQLIVLINNHIDIGI